MEKNYNLKLDSLEQFNIEGICISWPYIVYSTTQNILSIYSVFQPNELHMIQLSPDDRESDVELCCSHITETYDLIFVTKDDKSYHVYKIDLDASNFGELDEDTSKPDALKKFLKE